MKRLAFLVAIWPSLALAQQPQLSPQDEALQQRIIQLTGDAINWQAQAIAAQRQVADLQKQLDAAKAKPAP